MTLTAALTAILLLLAAPVQAGGLPMVNAHSQIDGDTDMDVVIKTMDQAGIGRVLL